MLIEAKYTTEIIRHIKMYTWHRQSGLIVGKFHKNSRIISAFLPLPFQHQPIFLFYWSRVDLQYCVSFKCTAISYACVHIQSFLDFFPHRPVQSIDKFPGLYSRSLLLLVYIFFILTFTPQCSQASVCCSKGLDGGVLWLWNLSTSFTSYMTLCKLGNSLTSTFFIRTIQAVTVATS